jgi:hypothetical protein
VKKPRSGAGTPTPPKKQKPYPSRADQLTLTQQRGVRRRQNWMARLSRQGKIQNWSLKELRAQVSKDADRATRAGRIKSMSARDTLIDEGRLSGDPNVRDEFARILGICNELWDTHRAFLRKVLHGHHQLFVYALRQQRRSEKRNHVASVGTFLAHLKEEYGEVRPPAIALSPPSHPASKAASAAVAELAQVPPKSAIEPHAIVAPTPKPAHAQVGETASRPGRASSLLPPPRRGVPRVPVSCRLDPETYEYLRETAKIHGQSAQQIVGAAIAYYLDVLTSERRQEGPHWG